MKSENSASSLVEVIAKLGLPQSVINELRLNLCFQPDRFFLHHQQERGQDRLRLELCVQKVDSANEYAMPFYEACLQKVVLVPYFQDAGVNSVDLEKKMSVIDWQALHTEVPNGGFDTVEEIVSELNVLSREPEGQQVADLLRWKYWSSTPFFIHCHNSRVLKNDFEVVQRFYIFENEEIISIDDAYRFLCHRWREKQLQSMKKQGNKSVTEVTASVENKKRSKPGPLTKGNRGETKAKSKEE